MKYLLTLSLCFSLVAGFSQIEDPVKWDYAAVKKSDNLYELKITAIVSKPWHIYSQTTAKGGPVPTSFVFKKNPLITAEGKLKENGKMETIHDKNFDVDVKYYSDKVEFVQIVKLKGKAKTNITGTVEYMVCNDEKCLPPTKKSFDVKLQ